MVVYFLFGGISLIIGLFHTIGFILTSCSQFRGAFFFEMITYTSFDLVSFFAVLLVMLGACFSGGVVLLSLF